MEAVAKVKTVGVPATKLRLILNEIRGKDVEFATAFLRHVPNRGAVLIGKVLKSAVANAAHNHNMNTEDLYIKACYADESLTIKRFRPRAKGSAAPIHKRTSHITVIVANRG